jgi:DNA-binding SARP family transcriptional activator
MEFLILGPLEVRSDDGQPVRVRASKQRMLLAMLLVVPKIRREQDHQAAG